MPLMGSLVHWTAAQERNLWAKRYSKRYFKTKKQREDENQQQQKQTRPYMPGL